MYPTMHVSVVCAVRVPANQNKTLQEKAKAVLRRQMKHVMFTDPEIIQAGERVTLYYNPDDTMLAGTE